MKLSVMGKPKYNRIADYEDLIESLKISEMPFEMFATTFTKKIHTLRGNYKFNFQNGIPLKEIYFISKVDKEIVTGAKIATLLNLAGLSNEKPYPTDTKHRISYFNKNTFRNRYISKDLYEIDLTAAYWTLAHKHDLISTDLFQEGLRLSKKIRLVSLGALAKRVLHMKFDGFEFEVEKDKFNPKANVFFKVSYLTDKYLKQAFLSLGKSAIFYWVDALFLQGEKELKFVSDFFRDNGLAFKVYKIDRINFTNNVYTVKSKDYANKHEGRGESRVFNFEKE